MRQTVIYSLSALALVSSLAACGGDDYEPANPGATPSPAVSVTPAPVVSVTPSPTATTPTTTVTPNPGNPFVYFSAGDTNFASNVGSSTGDIKAAPYSQTFKFGTADTITLGLNATFSGFSANGTYSAANTLIPGGAFTTATDTAGIQFCNSGMGKYYMPSAAATPGAVSDVNGKSFKVYANCQPAAWIEMAADTTMTTFNVDANGNKSTQSTAEAMNPVPGTFAATLFSGAGLQGNVGRIFKVGGRTVVVFNKVVTVSGASTNMQTIWVAAN